ncbi:MAG: HDIG domain-containing protein [Clostridiales bacterium]|nr:HDIG domain-containing protein [Clostridiales bacterium]
MVNLTMKNTFNEITSHLLNDNSPSEYFNDLDKELREYPLSMIRELKNVEQSPKFHPEGNVWNHTMMVVDEAAKVKDYSNDSKVFMWAALLHDIGKPDTTKVRRGKITSYDHDIVGARLARKFLEFYTKDEDFIDTVFKMVKYHMHMLYVLKGLPFGNPARMIEETNIHDIALLCRCDRLGRIGADIEAEHKNYKEFLKVLQSP